MLQLTVGKANALNSPVRRGLYSDDKAAERKTAAAAA
jgi:hypothetical protein